MQQTNYHMYSHGQERSLHNCTLLILPDPRGIPLSSSHHDPSAFVRSSLPLSVLITLLQSVHPFRALIPLVLFVASDPSSCSRPLPLDPLVLSYSTSRATQVPGTTLTSSHSFGSRKRSTVYYLQTGGAKQSLNP